MEFLINPIVNAIHPPVSYVLGGLAAAVALTPQLARVYSEWIDFRTGRRRMELDRDRLEIVKLQYEIEALRQQHPLPESVTGEMAIVARGPTRPSPPTAAPPRWVQWLLGRPRIGTPLLVTLQGVFWLWAVFSAVAAFAVPAALLLEPSGPAGSPGTGPGISPGMAVTMFVVYGLFAWVFWLGFRRLRGWRSAKERGAEP